MPTLDDLLRETEDKVKKKGGLDALLQATEPPKAKGLDALLAETGGAQPIPTLTPTPFPSTPTPGNIEQTAKQQILSKRDRERELLRAAQQVDSETLARKVQTGGPLTDIERRAWQEQSGQAIPTRELETAAVVGTSVLFPPLAVGPAALGTIGRTALGSGIVGSAENTAIELGSSIAERKLPDPTELAISAGTGFVGGAIGGAVASGVLGKTGDNITFGRKVKDIADYHGTSPNQINKYLKETAEQLGTDRGTIADGVIGHAVKTQPEGAQAFNKYLKEIAEENLTGPQKFSQDIGGLSSDIEKPNRKGFEQFAYDTGNAPSGLQVRLDEDFVVANVRTDVAEDVGKTFTRTLDTGTMDELTQTVKNVITGIEDPLEQPLNKQMKMMHVVSEWLHDGRIQMPRLRPTLERLGIDPIDYMRFEAEEFKRTSTHAGRHLNFLSQLSKEYRKAFKGTPAEAAFDELAKKADKHPWWNTTARWFKNLINFHRGSVVTQPATAARNAASAKFRAALEIFETVLDDLQAGRPVNGIKTAAGQTKTLIWRTGEEIMDIFTLGKVMNGPQAGKFMKLLEKDFPLQHVKLTETSVHEVAMVNKWLKVANYFNSAQEMHNRRIGYEMRLRTNLARLGVTDFDNFDPKLIPQKEYVKAVEDAVNFALDMTFANEAQNPVSKAMVRMFRDYPILQPLFNEFPRFNFGNAWQYMWEYSPGGFLKYLDPAARQAYRAGNTRAMSRAMIGTALTAAGYALRSSEYAGEKWYQLQYGDKTIDTRAMFPLPFYLFLGELIHNPKNVGPADFALMATGMNRVAGTGLIIADIIRDNGRTEQGQNLIKDFVGSWFGGFTVPFAGPKDIIGGIQQTIDPNTVAGEAAYREQKENLLFGPILSNIPGVGTLQDKGIIDVGLPQTATPFTGGEPGQKQHPILRQLTGITMQDRPPLQNEVSKFDLYRSFYSSTGIPKADRKLDEYRGIIIKNMGDPVIEPMRIGDMTVTPEMYNSLPPPAQRIILRKYAEEVRKRSMDMLEILDPVLYQKVKIRKMDKDEAELLGIDQNNPFNE